MFDELKTISEQVQDLLVKHQFPNQLVPAVLKEGCLAYPSRAGKMLRPALLLWSCGLFRDDNSPALPVAAAVELFHTWTLVHDDIIDDDDLRRGGPSVHRLVEERTMGSAPEQAATFGVNMAILAGDVQQAWCNDLILNAELPAELRLRIAQRLNGMVTPLLITGEAMDVEFELRPFSTISPDEMEMMLRYKTALLLRFAAETGAMIGLNTDDETTPQVKALGEFAELVGVAFQIRDDILGMYGDVEKLGKPIGSDLIQGKRNYLFACAYEHLEGAELARFDVVLGDTTATRDEIEEIAELLRSGGALEQAEAKAVDYAQRAYAILDELPHSHYLDLLRNWAEFACNRDW